MKEIKAWTLYFLFFIFFILIITYIFPKLDSNFKNIFETFYWAIITVSTVGYGEITPHTTLTRILTIILIILSTIAVSLFTAIVTNRLIQKTIFKIKEWENLEKLNRHLIICGYKPQFKTLLKEFINSNKRFNVDGIVIINEELTPTIEMVLEEMEYIKFIKGDFSEEEILLKAKAKNAAKAIIIGERDENSDSKVLATSILLKSLNKNIYLIAEINNPKFEKYLEKIDCDEIILNEEYNKHLLSKAITDPGISRVIGNLIKDKNFKIIYAQKTGISYKEIFDEMLQKNSLLIGVIENYGNLKKLKKEYVKEAEESPNIDELYNKIHSLKDIEINKVVLTPDNNYIIQPHTALIVLERKNDV
jgi:voltage-gated potassium channel